MINHNYIQEELIPGLYRSHRSGLVTVWDMRLKSKDYITPEGMHSIEHTLDNYLRLRFGNHRIVLVAPMGCQTGFYIVTRYMNKYQIYDAVVDYSLHLQRIGTVPGCNTVHCIHPESHNLVEAKRVMLEYYDKYLRYSSKATKYN